METKNKKQVTYIVVAVLFLLILIIGAAYSYFQIIANNNTTTSTISGSSELVGQATLTTNDEGKSLKLNITASMMSKQYENTTYYATPSGTPVTSAEEGNGIYTLATASITESDVPLYCTYTYDISLTENLTKDITDGSDEDFKVVIIESDGKEKPYTLAQIKSGVTHTGKIKKLAHGTDQKIKIKAYVTNTESNQNDLSGISISIKIQPRSGESGFSCDLPKPTAAEELIASGKLWSSGLEGDGYRYVGSGAYNSKTTPNNFICFGTTDKTECKNNEAKYMYRIIGVFEGSDGELHLKLISLKQLGVYAWNDDYETDVSWENSDMYKGLNGSYFLTNTTYDYLQNNTWLNKIEDWTWSAVNTKMYEGGQSYNSITTQEMYLYEMNRSSKSSSIGEWSTPTAKIGLMYASDYQMSLGSSSLSYTGISNYTTLKTGWMHQSNNDTTKSNYELTLSRTGDISAGFYAWYVDSDGGFIDCDVDRTDGARPVFHLTSDARINGGNGSYSNPYILAE